jgi:catechol 2,3-dioxygenase-like lactoylglutathione lyase family enzyme
MSIHVLAINHVGLVVQSQAKAEMFYEGILGLSRHEKIDSWFYLNQTCLLHLIEIPEATPDASLYHEVQHFALQVKDLTAVLALLIENALTPFQMDFEGNVRAVTSRVDALDFGIGTLFVNDPDGNLIEFVQLGKGKFQEL